MAEKLKTAVPTSDEFCQTLAHATWLMTLSKTHKEKTVSWINAHVVTPLMFKQVRIFSKEKQPLAAVIWAYVSPEVKQKLDAGDYTMSLQDWRSGSEVVVVDCISPLMKPQMFIDQFMLSVRNAQTKQNK